MSKNTTKDKPKKNKKRRYWPEVLLVFSAMILGVLVVFLVYKTTNRNTHDPQEFTIAGAFPTPSELRPSDKGRYFAIMEVPDMIFNKINGVTFWSDGPVTRQELRYVQLLYWGIDGEAHKGEMIVHEKIAEKVQDIFFSLYSASYPIECIKLVDEYGGNDEVSMAYNNTSCFNCRKMTGSDRKWSAHAYGLAIDLNPLYNPFVGEDGEVLPVDGEPYTDRTLSIPMLINPDHDYAYRLFVDSGFTWGGDWEGVKDYQHFEYAID